MDTYNNMETKRITINQAKKVLENINTYVHVGKFETGLRTNLKRVKSKCYTTTYEYNGFLENATKLAIIAEVNIYRVFEVERSETCYYLKNDYTEYNIYIDNKTKFYYTEIKGNKFIAVTYMGVCNVYQLFSEILPMSGNTENEIKDKLINVYNELQTGKEIQVKTNVGLLNINLMKPGNFALVIEGRTVHTLPNKFETFCDYLKKFML